MYILYRMNIGSTLYIQSTGQFRDCIWGRCLSMGFRVEREFGLHFYVRKRIRLLDSYLHETYSYGVIQGIEN
jgi:hypothetical protein